MKVLYKEQCNQTKQGPALGYKDEGGQKRISTKLPHPKKLGIRVFQSLIETPSL